MRYPDMIYCKDCVAGIKNLPDGSADIIIADPPYNIGKNFGTNHDKLPLAEYVAWSGEWIGECLRVLKDAGAMFIYGFPEILAHISVRLPLAKQKWLQWHYTNKNMPSLNFWQRSHESILCVWTGRPRFNRDAVREPYTSGFLKGSAGRKRPAGDGRFSRGNGADTTYNAHANGALPRDVIHVGALAGGAGLKERNIFCRTCGSLVNPGRRAEHNGHELIIHPTQKPLELTRRLILASRPASGFNLLVPFCGSGSECKCALALDGSFVGFEINEDYVRLASEVIKACRRPPGA